MKTKNPMPHKGIPENSFAMMPELRRRFPRPNTKWLWVWRLRYWILAQWRQFRIQKWLYPLLGPQYRRSRDMIEIDITYLCNLHCNNCNRSVTQAREANHMSVEMVRQFVDDSISHDKQWRRIRVLGGEPTLHPHFHQVLEELLRYRSFNSSCIVEVVTNGHGKKVQRILESIPEDILIDNSNKESSIQPHFGPFNLAPIDDPKYAHTTFANGCTVLEECGMGLTTMGYYPCAVAGGIDRILKQELGRNQLPSDTDDMFDMAEILCALCGRFRDGHFIPRVLRPELHDAPISDTWQQLYAQWHAEKEKTK